MPKSCISHRVSCKHTQTHNHTYIYRTQHARTPCTALFIFYNNALFTLLGWRFCSARLCSAQLRLADVSAGSYFRLYVRLQCRQRPSRSSLNICARCQRRRRRWQANKTASATATAAAVVAVGADASQPAKARALHSFNFQFTSNARTVRTCKRQRQSSA